MRDTPSTVIGVFHAELRLPMAASLKEKRSVLRPLLRHLSDHFKLAVAEVADQDIWGAAVIAAAAVSSDKKFVERVLQKARDYLDSRPDIEVVDVHIDIL